jgi:hypothetical protein
MLRESAQAAEYREAKAAFDEIIGKMSVPPTDTELAIARRFVVASRYRFRRTPPRRLVRV